MAVLRRCRRRLAAVLVLAGLPPGACGEADTRADPLAAIPRLAFTVEQRLPHDRTLFNWGFQSYDAVTLFAKDQPVDSLRVWKGAQPSVKVGFGHDLSIAVPRGYADKIKSEFTPQVRLLAPIEAGQKLGTMKVLIDGKVYGEYPVVAQDALPRPRIIGPRLDTQKHRLK